jgi:hypothetical protein
VERFPSDDHLASFFGIVPTSRDSADMQPIMFYMDIVDRNQAVFGPAFPAGEQEMEQRQEDLWTNNLKFVQGMHAMFEGLWKVSTNHFRQHK